MSPKERDRQGNTPVLVNSPTPRTPSPSPFPQTHGSKDDAIERTVLFTAKDALDPLDTASFGDTLEAGSRSPPRGRASLRNKTVDGKLYNHRLHVSSPRCKVFKIFFFLKTRHSPGAILTPTMAMHLSSAKRSINHRSEHQDCCGSSVHSERAGVLPRSPTFSNVMLLL